MSLTVKSQPGTAKIFRFSISSSNTPRALQVLRRKQNYALTVWKHFHISSHSHSKKNAQSKKNITTEYRILMSEIYTELRNVTNIRSTIQAFLPE